MNVIEVDTTAYEVVQQINSYLRLQTPVLDWLRQHVGANQGLWPDGSLRGDWCWDYIGSNPNFQVRVTIRDSNMAMLFKLMWGT